MTENILPSVTIASLAWLTVLATASAAPIQIETLRVGDAGNVARRRRFREAASGVTRLRGGSYRKATQLDATRSERGSVAAGCSARVPFMVYPLLGLLTLGRGATLALASLHCLVQRSGSDAGSLSTAHRHPRSARLSAPQESLPAVARCRRCSSCRRTTRPV